MKAHVIENNIIVNTITVNNLSDFPNLTLIDASNGGSLGDIYNDGDFIKQTLSLQQLKTNKLSQVQLKKNEMIDAGFLVNDIKFDIDIAARLAYTELGLQLQANPEFTTMWKASDGVWVTMNSALYQQVIAAGKTHIESCFAWQAAKEIEINTSSTIEELKSIEI